MPARNPEDRRRIASIAARACWEKTEDRTERTAKARAALASKFLEAANGDPVVAESLRTDYYKRIAQKSVEARQARRRAL